MVLALGITLAFGGLVTHAAISVMGIVLALIAGVGWWREVFPEQRVERITLRTIELRPPTVMPWRPAVERASIGGGGHRARVPVEIQPYSAGIKGGIVGGIVMAALALAYGLVVQRSVWYPINLLSAVAMPSLAHATVAELRAFSLTAFVIGIVVHGLISVLVGLLYAVILLWTSLVWAVLGIVDPMLNARVDWTWFVVSQIGFGLTTGFVVARAHPLATRQTWPLATRAGVETSTAGSEQTR